MRSTYSPNKHQSRLDRFLHHGFSTGWIYYFLFAFASALAYGIYQAGEHWGYHWVPILGLPTVIVLLLDTRRNARRTRR